MKKFFSIIQWEDPSKFETKHPVDQRNIIIFGIVLCLIVTIEFIAGFYNASMIFNASPYVAIIAAIIWALVIYSIEVLIILAPASKPMFFARLVIGTIIAMIGAFTVDTGVFKKEIDYQLKENERLRIENEFNSTILGYQKSIEQAKEDWNHFNTKAINEADGSSPSAKFGAGAVYRAKKQAADDAKQHYEKLKIELSNIQSKKDLKINESLNAAIEKAGFLSHIKAHFQFMFSDIFALVIGILISSFILIIQMMVVFLKLVLGEGIEKSKIEANAKSIKNAIKMKQKIDISECGQIANLFEPDPDLVGMDYSINKGKYQ